MPQPLPISKRKTQNHLTTNKNINKHRTNMFVFMSKKKNHFCLLPTPFVLFDVVHRRLHEKKDKNASIYHQPGFSSSRKFLTEKNVFIPKKVCLCHQFTKKTEIYLKTLRASRITTIPNLDLTYLDTSVFIISFAFIFFVCLLICLFFL